MIIVLNRDQYTTKNDWLELEPAIVSWCIANLKEHWTLEHRIKQMVLVEERQPIGDYLPGSLGGKHYYRTIKNFVSEIGDKRMMQFMVVDRWAEMQFTSEDDMLKFKLFWT